MIWSALIRTIVLVELPDARRLAFHVPLELCQAAAPVAHVGVQLAHLPFLERQGELLVVRLAPVEFLDHALSLAFQRLVQVPTLAFSPLGQTPFRGRGEFGGARFELGAQLVYVARRPGQQPAPDDLVRPTLAPSASSSRASVRVSASRA